MCVSFPASGSGGTNFMTIPTYSAAGVPLRGYSLAEVERKLASGDMRVSRKRGQIVCARFLPAHFEDETTGGELRAVRFTKRERTGIGNLTMVVHKPLPYAAVDAELGHLEPREVVDCAVKASFQGVLKSICREGKLRSIARDNAAHRGPKSVSIDRRRAQRVPSLPIGLKPTGLKPTGVAA